MPNGFAIGDYAAALSAVNRFGHLQSRQWSSLIFSRASRSRLGLPGSQTPSAYSWCHGEAENPAIYEHGLPAFRFARVSALAVGSNSLIRHSRSPTSLIGFLRHLRRFFVGCIEQPNYFLKAPHMVGDPCRHCWRDPQRPRRPSISSSRRRRQIGQLAPLEYWGLRIPPSRGARLPGPTRPDHKATGRRRDKCCAAILPCARKSSNAL